MRIEVGIHLFHVRAGEIIVQEVYETNFLAKVKLGNWGVLEFPLSEIGTRIFLQKEDRDLGLSQKEYLSHIEERHEKKLEVEEELKKTIRLERTGLQEQKELKERERLRLKQAEERTENQPDQLKSNKLKNDLEYDKLHNILKSYSFEGFHHYTDFSNFIGIFHENNLFSRAGSKKNNSLKCDAADKSVISNTNPDILQYVRFYYAAKTPTLYKCEGVKLHVEENEPHMPMPVLLVFKEEIVRHLGVKFSSGNAGSKYSTITSECSMAYSAFEWNEIFHRGPYDKSDYHTERKIINHRNAELLYPNAISLDFAKQIIFRTISDYKNAVNLLGERSIFSVNSNKFYCHRGSKYNYLKDYDIIVNGTQIALNLSFAISSPKEYTHSLEIIYNSGYKDVVTLDAAIVFSGYEDTYEILVNKTQNESFELAYYFNGHRCIYYFGR